MAFSLSRSVTTSASGGSSLFGATSSAASGGSSLFGATQSSIAPHVSIQPPSAATSAAFFTPFAPLFGKPVQPPSPFATPAVGVSTPAVSFATPASTSSPSFATAAPTSSPSFATPAATSSPYFATPVAMSLATTTAAPSTFSAASTSAALTAGQFFFPGAISSSSVQTSSTAASVGGACGGCATTTIMPFVFPPRMPSEIRGKTKEKASDGDCGDDAAGDGSEAKVLKAVPFQLMQQDETWCKGDPVSVEEWRTLIEAISTVALDGGNDVCQRVAKRSGRHCDVFSPMVDLSLRCQQERQRREELDARIVEQSKEVHMLRNEIEQLQMAAAERERMPALRDWWGIWQREVRRAAEEKQRADEERQQVKELAAELRQAERKLGYHKDREEIEILQKHHRG